MRDGALPTRLETVSPCCLPIQDRYCGILLDDNNRKPICRLWLNSAQKYIGLFDGKKQEERVPIDDLDDIYKLADRLKGTVAFYE